MIEKLSGIKLNIGEDESVLVGIAQKKLGAKPSYFRILKKSLDARNKNDIFMTYSIEFSLDELPRKEEIARVPEKNLPSDPIVIVGAGPRNVPIDRSPSLEIRTVQLPDIPSVFIK